MRYKRTPFKVAVVRTLSPVAVETTHSTVALEKVGLKDTRKVLGTELIVVLVAFCGQTASATRMGKASFMVAQKW